MTQEKELLLKDLCTRLPYGVIVLEDIDKTFDGGCISELATITEIKGEKMFLTKNSLTPVTIEEIRPYLRPISSMTDEEKEKIAFIRDRDFQFVRKWIHDESIKETGNICPITCGEIDYCNKKHLDYRDLISMGLALEAPEGMYNIKEE